MDNLYQVILPELVLVLVACALFLLGISARAAARRVAAWLALVAVVAVVVIQGWGLAWASQFTLSDPWNTLEVGPFANYVKLLTGVVGVMLVLLAWPTNPDATGSASLDFGRDGGEFYALMLLSLAGLLLVAGANDIMLLFLGIELASIPTYIMVSMSRPIPAAQEAGVKYFFLGAMAAAIMLFGFSYLYGTTGYTKLSDIGAAFNVPQAGGGERAHAFTAWQVLAVLLLLAGFAFKIAAVPLHAYVGDVYEGAATPVTAFLAFVPKTAGFVAIIKVLAAVGGGDWQVPPEVVSLLWVLAVLTMTVGNTLGLLQSNVKRVLAYSSVAHSGYMLVGVTALVAAGGAIDDPAVRATVQRQALGGVLFYLAAYGIMNAGAFGVLMLLPARESLHAHGGVTAGGAPPATSAETFEDLAGVGRRHLALGLAMAVCCFSLIGMPLTVGFFGKLYLIQPAFGVAQAAADASLRSRMNWLVVLTVANAAVGAAYYLRIIATMFLRADPDAAPSHVHAHAQAQAQAHTHDAHVLLPPGGPRFSPISASIALSVALTLLFGVVFPATNALTDRSLNAAQFERTAPFRPGLAGHPAAAAGDDEPAISSVNP
jgi:NADH-quinone oxidoreductase subunit N